MAEQQVERKKWKIPRGAAAKNKYRDNKYDRAELAVPKGFRARMKQIAQEQGYKDGRHRLRIGKYRVIDRYTKDGEVKILIVMEIGSRGDIYKQDGG